MQAIWRLLKLPFISRPSKLQFKQKTEGSTLKKKVVRMKSLSEKNRKDHKTWQVPCVSSYEVVFLNTSKPGNQVSNLSSCLMAKESEVQQRSKVNSLHWPLLL